MARWRDGLRAATFRRQLSLAVAAGVLGVAAVSAVLSSWQGSLQVRETLVRQGLNLATSLAQQSQLALLTGGAENAREPVERALSFPDVLRVELLQADGAELLARGVGSAVAAARPLPGAVQPYLEAETGAAWTFVAPVRMRPGEASPFEAAAAQTELLGFVRVTQGKAALVQLVRRLVLINFGVGLALSALLLWALRQLARRLTRPLGELAEVMALAGEGRLGLRAPVEGPRDIANMAQVFNGMMHSLELREQELQQKNEELARHALTLEERVEERTHSLSSSNRELQQALDTLRDTQRQLIEVEKLASLGRLVAGVAHELNTPLGNALMAASTLQAEQSQLSEAMHAGQLRKSEFDRMLNKSIEGNVLVVNNVRRAAEIIRGFKQLALDQTTDMRRVFLANEVIGELLATLQPMFRHSPHRLEVELEPDLQMDSYPGPLGQVISNVVQNALLHGLAERDQGRVTVQCHAQGEDRVQIVCSDDGEGMDEAVRLRVFEAFFTTKLGQGGSGLGMQIVHSLVTGLLGGRVQVESEPRRGTRILISLPRQAPQSPGSGSSRDGTAALDSPPGA